MKVLFRCEAGEDVGFGHGMRCLALAEALIDQGAQPDFLMSGYPEMFQTLLDDAGIHQHVLDAGPYGEADFHETQSFLVENDYEWVVLDGYGFDQQYIDALGASRTKLLCIDDKAQKSFASVNVLVNQNLHASQESYKSGPYPTYLLGAQYVLLRDQFLETQANSSDEERRILVTFGGIADSVAYQKFIQALKNDNVPKNTHFDLIIPEEASFEPELRAVIHQMKAEATFHKSVKDMASLLSVADVAICAGGSTCWELCYFGVPMVVGWLRENQRPIVKALAKSGVALSLGSYQEAESEKILTFLKQLLANPEDYRVRSKKAQELVDGKGKMRVVQEMYDDLTLQL